MSYSKAGELIALATMAAGRHVGVTIDDVRERFRISKRTAQRMLRALESQFPDTDIANDSDGRRRWRLRTGALRDLMTLSADELAALDLAAETIARSGLTVEAESLLGLREKILALVPRAQAARIETDLEALLEAQGLAARPGPRQRIERKVVAAISESIKACRILEVEYRALPKPDHIIRRVVISKLSRSLKSSEAEPETLQKAEQAFVDGTEGLLVADVANIVQLARVEGLAVTDAAEAVRRYKLGITEDVWHKIDREKLKGAEQYVEARVRGQDHAVQHMLDIVKRAATGIGGKRGGRPRGVAFLAGPTGVGKTELAKTITSLLFGDESAYILFDMSEFSAEHADQRLIGAPPGYLGYDSGGELTNAIRQKPFSVVLFDEIEKAHPRILDKFLQILDDGVLTSGRGERVYFSESLIIFTSNLGMTRTLQDGSRVANATPGEPLDEVRRKVRLEIERHFKLEISRPEILNRIGENVIVFDFIRPPVAREILELMVGRVVDDVRAEQQLTLSFTPQARAHLEELCLGDLSNGGRGIRNQVEVHLINPLARALFALDPQPGDSITIADVRIERGMTTLTLAK